MSRRYTQPAAYQALPGGPLDVDREFYTNLAAAPRELISSFELPPREGQAWRVDAGSIVKLSITEGAQVGDLNLFNAHDPAERFWAARTRQLQRSSVTTFDRLWSTLPSLRPLVTVVADSLADHPDAAVIHDLLGTRCDPYVNRMLTGDDADHHCHSNLVRAVAEFGLGESDVHDVLNVFQFAGLNDSGQYFMDACPAGVGDHIEFFCEIDLIFALSTCPGGDLSVRMWGDGAASTEEQLEHCHPLGVEVFRPECSALQGWSSPARAAYAGGHGLTG